MSLNIQILFLFIQILCLFSVVISSLKTIQELRTLKEMYRTIEEEKGIIIKARDKSERLLDDAKTDYVNYIVSVNEKNWERARNDCTK